MNKIDQTDIKIIKLLQKNGRMSNTEIAKNSEISETTVRYRMQRLIKEEYIEIAAIIDPMKLGNGIEGTIRIQADIKQMKQVTKALKLIPELFYVARVAGKADFDTSFFVKNMNEARILIDRINLIEGVIDTDMATVLEYIKERYDYEWG
jgi:Lrp/AsnC family transcriptional regulator for asnA, asnC and gidA